MRAHWAATSAPRNRRGPSAMPPALHARRGTLRRADDDQRRPQCRQTSKTTLLQTESQPPKQSCTPAPLGTVNTSWRVPSSVDSAGSTTGVEGKQARIPERSESLFCFSRGFTAAAARLLRARCPHPGSGPTDRPQNSMNTELTPSDPSPSANRRRFGATEVEAPMIAVSALTAGAAKVCAVATPKGAANKTPNGFRPQARARGGEA